MREIDVLKVSTENISSSRVCVHNEFELCSAPLNSFNILIGLTTSYCNKNAAKFMYNKDFFFLKKKNLKYVHFGSRGETTKIL